MNDFTLIIPTYNRPQQLAALLRYLEGAEWNIIVLNSSKNTEVIHHPTACQYLYNTDTHPFDKFESGLQYVTTEYCALLADDDIIMPSAVPVCLYVLRHNPSVAAVQGFAFAFECKDGKASFQSMMRPLNSISDDLPLMRVADLMVSYRALTYGIYRTATLRKVLHEANKLESLLGRELLASAMTAVEGRIVNIPAFSHGRSAAPSEMNYKNWHPLEWYIKDSDGLTAEYARYRKLLSKALFRAKFGGTSSDINVVGEMATIEHCLDLIHLRYLLGYCPTPLIEYLTGHFVASGKLPMESSWPQELRDMLKQANVNSKLVPILGSDAVAEVNESLQQYSKAMVDPTSRDEVST